MKAEVYLVNIGIILCCAFTAAAEPPPLTYLQTQYINQFSHGSFGYTSPNYPATEYASSRVFIPRKPNVRPRVYHVPVTRYSIQTNDFEEEYNHEPPQYEFYYNVHDNRHGTQFGHTEYRDENVARGQYVVLLPDGRKQIVDYVADSNGYRPTVRYEGGFGYS